MTGDLLDRATREAVARARCTGPLPAPRCRAQVYAEAVMRLVEAGRREGEDLHDAYLRMRHQPTATLAAVLAIRREQLGRERRPVVH